MTIKKSKMKIKVINYNNQEDNLSLEDKSNKAIKELKELWYTVEKINFLENWNGWIEIIIVYIMNI